MKRIRVARARVAGWFERFAAAHGGAASSELEPDRVTVRAVDGSWVELAVPYAPMSGVPRTADGLELDELLAHLAVPRRIGLILVRSRAHSIGIAEDGVVRVSSTDRHYVQGKTAAGGWSQQRYARRRQGQRSAAMRAVTEDLRRVLLPELAGLDAVVLGGDRSSLRALENEASLRELFERAEPWRLDVPEPRRKVLDEAAVTALGVELVIHEAAHPSG